MSAIQNIKKLVKFNNKKTNYLIKKGPKTLTSILPKKIYK